MNTHKAIEFLDKEISNPQSGLPEELFLFISRLTPMVNVDLLIKDENGRILLAWRDDRFAGRGWHLPGGIVRFKESLEQRVREVAEKEIGVLVEFDPDPITIKQVICKHNTRGHFIALLYKCFLSGKFVPQNADLSKKDPGYLMWHDSPPVNLVKVHEIYKKYI